MSWFYREWKKINMVNSFLCGEVRVRYNRGKFTMDLSRNVRAGFDKKGVNNPIRCNKILHLVIQKILLHLFNKITTFPKKKSWRNASALMAIRQSSHQK